MEKFIKSLHHKARGGKGHPRPIRAALNWLEDNYTGDTRKAFRWQAFESTGPEITGALSLRMTYREILKGNK